MRCGLLRSPIPRRAKRNEFPVCENTRTGIENTQRAAAAIQRRRCGAHFLTLGEWLPHWLELYARPSVRHSTYVSYEGYVRKHLVPALGAVPLDKLVPADLQRFYLRKLQEDRLAPKTISNLHACLHQALQQAVKEQMIPSNPCDAVDLPRKGSSGNLRLTREQQAKLMQESYRHRYGVFIRLALSTGMRIRKSSTPSLGRYQFYQPYSVRAFYVESAAYGRRRKQNTIICRFAKDKKNGRRSIPLLMPLYRICRIGARRRKPMHSWHKAPMKTQDM